MAENSQTSSGPPLIFFTNKFQVAWQSAAEKTRARAK